MRFDATSGGFGATPERGIVVPFGVSVAIFVVFGATSIVCNATRGAASGFWWSGRITDKIGNDGMSSEPRNPENQREVS